MSFISPITATVRGTITTGTIIPATGLLIIMATVRIELMRTEISPIIIATTIAALDRSPT
jgi:hypothetical protein